MSTDDEIPATADRLLTGSLDGTSGQSGEQASSANMIPDVLGRLSDAGMLRSLIDSLIDRGSRSEDMLARARLSYRHPLGFRKIMLLANLPTYSLRAHVWPPRKDEPAPSDTSGHVHNHRFALASCVVRGAMTMRLFEAAAPGSAGMPMTYYQEEPGTTAAEGWRLRRLGPSVVRSTAELRMSAGSAYWLAADALHLSVPDSAVPTVTLFLETARIRRTTDIHMGQSSTPAAWTPRRPLDAEEYLRALAELRELIADG